MPGKEDRMDDSGRGLAAGNEASTGNNNAEPTQAQREVDALRLILEDFVDGVERDYTLNFAKHENSCVFVVRMTDTQHQANEVSVAGAPGSSVLFVDEVDERGITETSSTSFADWIRARFQEHLAVTPQTLVVVISIGIIRFLIDLALSRRDKRQMQQQYWKSIQAKRNIMGEKRCRELQEGTSGTGVAVEKTRDWKYKEAYILGVQTIVAAAAQTDMSPFEICSLVRKGQSLPEEAPDHCLDSGVSDGIHACRFAIAQRDMLNEKLEETMSQSPDTFRQIGWERGSVPEEPYEIVPLAPCGEEGEGMDTEKSNGERVSAEAVEWKNPKMLLDKAFAPKKSKLTHTNKGVALADADVLEECFDLTRDAIDNLTALQFWSNPVLDTLDAFPAPVQVKGDANGKDYWVFDEVKTWVINFRHACAVRVVSADVSRALAIFAEWRDEKQYPPWCWETIFGGRPNEES
jgi:hypothetical protein